MPWLDARIPVRLGNVGDARDSDALLVEGETAPPRAPSALFTPNRAAHLPGCACCVPRTGAARALADLFTRRAHGAIEFRAVVAVAASEVGETEVVEALRLDPVASARFRLLP